MGNEALIESNKELALRLADMRKSMEEEKKEFEIKLNDLIRDKECRTKDLEMSSEKLFSLRAAISGLTKDVNDDDNVSGDVENYDEIIMELSDTMRHLRTEIAQREANARDRESEFDAKEGIFKSFCVLYSRKRRKKKRKWT